MFAQRGAPRRVGLLADQGREFVSQEFADWCASHSVLLWHAAVQAPYQNGLAERSGGGILKALVSAVVKDKVVIGDSDMRNTVAEACGAYSQNPNVEGVSPLQCVTGRQPALHGSVLNNFHGCLAEHGIIDEGGSLTARMALRESARVAMVRLHFSRSIRRAELESRANGDERACAWGHCLLLEGPKGQLHARRPPTFDIVTAEVTGTTAMAWTGNLALLGAHV